MRRRGRNHHDDYIDGGWIDVVFSDDKVLTWSKPHIVGMTGNHNGNPPTLIEYKGVLYCAYANRSKRAICLSQSEDGGETWKLTQLLRKNGDSDIGYPQLFKRSDGQLVCVYYWSDFYEDCQRIEATIFKP